MSEKLAYRKKLIEVALPLEAINREAAREKSIRHGHPSTLHLWWARRPLAACRAVLFSSLVDDPSSDPHLLRPDGSHDEDVEGERRAHLFNLIEELVKWENSDNDTIINAARAEIARSVASRKVELGEIDKKHPLTGEITPWDLIVRGQVLTRAFFKDGKASIRVEPTKLPADAVNTFLAEHAPPVLDPFCGGGSIPLEAQRLGLRAYASDLNPVPVLITKALIEIPPKFAGQPPVNPEWQSKSNEEKAARLWRGAQGLAEDVRYYGKWMRDQAEKRIGHLYPKVKVTKEMAKDRPDLERYAGQELTVIAWLWARTVPSPNPALGGAHVPLVRSFWLSTKKGKEAWVEPNIDHDKKSYRFLVRTGTPGKDIDPKKGTVVRAGATCLLSGQPIPFEHVRAEGKAGRMRDRLMAIVAEGERGRVYLSPSELHVQVARTAKPKDYPDTPLPEQALSFRVMLYGMDRHYKLFTPRQLVALTTFSDLVMEARERVLTDCKGDNAGYADAIATYLGLAVSRSANSHCTLAIWSSGRDQSINAFGRQALPMTWDFPEVNFFAHAAGDFGLSCESMSRVIDQLHPNAKNEQHVLQADITKVPVEPDSRIISTDPPYYDNIGYADLSDFFYVWMRRSLNTVYPELFRTLLTPKAEELIASPYRHQGSKDEAMSFFETGLGLAFERMRESQRRDYPLTVFYAFKQSETDDGDDDEPSDGAGTASTGWETMLEGLIRANFAITGTWPMRTERDQGLKTGDNVLASSIILVCHPRAADAAMTTRKDFVAELKKELPVALRDLQSGNIAPVDLAQAAIGPGMAIYSSHSKVVNSDGTRMPVRTALQLINQALDEVLSELESEFDSETRWAIKWFEQHAHDEGAFGDAEILSKAMAVSVRGLRDAGFVKDGQGKVRLLRRAELDADWDPVTDKRPTIWEVTQHLIRRLEKDGDSGAAELLRSVGGLGEVARDLAYRLYSTCERKKWAEEARSYNALVVAWPEIVRMSREQQPKPRDAQADLF